MKFDIRVDRLSSTVGRAVELQKYQYKIQNA
jgi:hypothetical protein